MGWPDSEKQEVLLKANWGHEEEGDGTIPAFQHLHPLL